MHIYINDTMQDSFFNFFFNNTDLQCLKSKGLYWGTEYVVIGSDKTVALVREWAENDFISWLKD